MLVSRLRDAASAHRLGGDAEMLVEVLVGRAGAEAVMPTKTPSEPMMASQPWRTPASTRDLAPCASPMIARRTASGCCQRTARSTAPRRRARRCPCAGEQLRAPRPRLRLPSRWRRSTPAPSPSAGGDLVGAARRRGSRRRRRLRSCGRFWRVSASTLGRSLRFERELPALGGLDRVGRAEHQQVRDRAQRGEMLDRLMRRAVLAEADRVVRHHVDDALAHQRGEADRRAAVIGEHQERAASRG